MFLVFKTSTAYPKLASVGMETKLAIWERAIVPVPPSRKPMPPPSLLFEPSSVMSWTVKTPPAGTSKSGSKAATESVVVLTTDTPAPDPVSVSGWSMVNRGVAELFRRNGVVLRATLISSGPALSTLAWIAMSSAPKANVFDGSALLAV